MLGHSVWCEPLCGSRLIITEADTEAFIHPRSVSRTEMRVDVFKNKWLDIILLSDASFEKPLQPATSKWNSNL